MNTYNISFKNGTRNGTSLNLEADEFFFDSGFIVFITDSIKTYSVKSEYVIDIVLVSTGSYDV